MIHELPRKCEYDDGDDNGDTNKEGYEDTNEVYSIMIQRPKYFNQ